MKMHWWQWWWEMNLIVSLKKKTNKTNKWKTWGKKLILKNLFQRRRKRKSRNRLLKRMCKNKKKRNLKKKLTKMSSSWNNWVLQKDHYWMIRFTSSWLIIAQAWVTGIQTRAIFFNGTLFQIISKPCRQCLLMDMHLFPPQMN